MLFVAFHGQQLWSDDAGAWLTDSMGEDESCFVMVAPETLAMHHLYVIKSSVDLTGDRGVDAYWRTAEHVDAFLDAPNECNGLLLVAPNEAYSPGNGWLLVHEESAPFTLSGGGDTGVGRYSGLSHDAPSTKRLYPFVRWADHCHRGLGV